MKGKIILKRENKNFSAGYSLMKEQLPDQVKKIYLLHAQETAYYNTLKCDKRKSSYLLGRVVAKKAIANLLNLESVNTIFIDFGVFHFPVVKGLQNIQVSISHCDDLGVALAFPEEHPLGIDLEKIDENRIESFKSYIAVNEIELIAKLGLPLCVGYTIIWTIKEGLSKILRTGLIIDFKMLEITSLEKKGSIYVSTFRHYIQYKATSCQAGDYVCSLILPKNTSPELEDFWNLFENVGRIPN